MEDGEAADVRNRKDKLGIRCPLHFLFNFKYQAN